MKKVLTVIRKEYLERVRRIDDDVAEFGCVVATDQRRCQAVWMANVVVAEAALDTQPVLVGRPVASVHLDDPVVLDGHPGLTTDPAIRA